MYDKDKNISYHIAGYNNMETNNYYMLFLRHADGNEWYIPTGVVSGKIPYNKSEVIAISNKKSEIDHINEIALEARKKYYSIFRPAK